MDDRIRELMDRTGMSYEQCRRIVEQEDAAADYQALTGAAPARITPGDWRTPSPPPSSSPRSGGPPPSASSGSSAPGADCRCRGAGYYVLDVPYGDPGFGRLVPCACTEAARARRATAAAESLLVQLGAELGRLAGSTFDTFDVDRELWPVADAGGQPWSLGAQRRALQEARAVAELYAAGLSGWLYLHGAVGAGKSHLAAAIAGRAAAGGRTTAYVTAAGLITFLKAGFGDGSADRRLLALQRVELLVLDDLGTQRASRPGEWAFEQLYELLNDRYLHERATVITSNLPPDHLEERLRDRVLGMAVEVHLVASSYRQLRHGRA